MQLIKQQEFGGERPLYMQREIRLEEVTIHPGESSVKEGRDIEADHCQFEGKYVFWECKGIKAYDCLFTPTARSSVWYSRDIKYRRCRIDAPKMFRRASIIDLEDCQLTDAQETFWDCDTIQLRNVTIDNADYLFMHAHTIRISDYRQNGNYSFQYAKNVEIHHALINSKDAFWEAEDCTIYDSEINGEYLGWYSKNLRLVRCRITGEQPLCYCTNLVLEDCTFGDDANLALEYSTVEATIQGHVVSIKNPTSGHIRVDSCGEIILDCNQKAPADAEIICS